MGGVRERIGGVVSGGTGCFPTCHGSMGTDGAVGIAAVHALIRMGADVNARDRSGATPLFLAAEGGRGAAVSALLAAGAEPAVRNNLGESALYIAALKGHGAALLTLLQHCEANGLPWQARPLHTMTKCYEQSKTEQSMEQSQARNGLIRAFGWSMLCSVWLCS